LIGVRSGDIIEAVLEEHVVAPEYSNQFDSHKIEHKFIFRLYLSAHSSLSVSKNLKKIHLAINEKYPLFVTVGDDETIRLWDIRKRVALLSKNLGASK
jgi:WD40 repeat protein